jgi:hypothetical protein
MKLNTGYSIIQTLASLGLLAALAGWQVVGWYFLGSIGIDIVCMLLQALGRHPV